MRIKAKRNPPIDAAASGRPASAPGAGSTPPRAAGIVPPRPAGIAPPSPAGNTPPRPSGSAPPRPAASTPLPNPRRDAQARWQRGNRFVWDKGGSRGGRR